MDYIESNLADDEEIMARIKHSWAGLISTAIIVIVLVALSIVCFRIFDIVVKIAYKIEGENLEEVPDYGRRIYNIFGGVMGALMLFSATLVLLSAIIEIKCAQLVVTNKRIFGRRGLISKHTTDIMLSKVDTINVNNGFFGAIFHYGTIELVSGATGTMTRAQRATLRYAYISNTEEFRKAVLETIDKVKKEESEAQARSIKDAMNRG